MPLSVHEMFLETDHLNGGNQLDDIRGVAQTTVAYGVK